MNNDHRFTRLIVLSLAVSLAAFPGAARGQTPIEITASGGLFLPTADVFRSVILVSPNFNLPEAFVVVSKTGHEPAFSIGARLTSWLSPRLALEGGVSFSESRVTVSQEIEDFFPPPPGVALQASVLAATARARVRLGPTDSPISFTLAGGGGVLSRGGDAYDALQGTTDFTAVLGTGLSIRVAPNVALRVDVEDYLSWPTVTLPVLVRRDPLPGQQALDDGRFQNDLVISQGLTILLGGGS